jgi:peptidoglycan/LPS O-acetylase OafA/YrhL
MEERGARLSHIPSLDGIRAIAILMVFVWHYVAVQIDPGLWGGLGRRLYVAMSWTWSGVDLFFVLSGFLIGRILIFNRGSAHYFRTFYARRVLRIFPVYYVVLAAFLIVSALGLRSALPWLMLGACPTYSYALYIQNFFMVGRGFGAAWLGVTWSLAIEEQFYLLLPLVVHLVSRARLPELLRAGVMIAPVLRALLPGVMPSVLLPARMDSLLLGVLIAHYHLDGTIGRIFGRRRGLLAGLTAAAVAAVVLLVVCGANEFGGVANHSVYALLYALTVVWVLVDASPRFTRLLQNGVLQYIGRISYALYLFHEVVSGLVHQLVRHQAPRMRSLPDVGATVGAFLLTIGLASLSYYLLERPLLDLGKRWKY